MFLITIMNGEEKTIIHHPKFNHLKVDGPIKEAINVADSFTFTILPNNPGYSLIRPLKTLVTVLNMKTGKVVFDGRILMPTQSMAESGVFAKSFVCESELGYLNDSCQRLIQLSNDVTVEGYLARVIANHNRWVEDDDIDKTFKLGNVTVEDPMGQLPKYIDYGETFETIDNSLIKVLGGELQVRKENGVRYLDYLREIGEVKKTEIKLSRNLKTIKEEVDPSSIITVLFPLGKQADSPALSENEMGLPRLTISEVNNGIDYLVDSTALADYGVVAKVQTWDEIVSPSSLKAVASRFLIENNRVKKKYTVGALDLSLIGLDIDSFEKGNYHPVKNSVMKIDETLRIIEKTTSILNPNQNSLTIGDRFKTVSQYQNEANKEQKKIVSLRNTVTRQTAVISSISTDLTNTKQELSNTKTTLDTLKGNSTTTISELSGEIDEVLSAIEAINGAISDIEGIISSEAIAQMNTNIEKNTSDISAINEQITVINNSLNELSERVAKLENQPEEGGTI